MSRVISSAGLRALCAKAGYRIGDMAYLCGASRQSIHKLSQGASMPILELALAQNLHVTVAHLRKAMFNHEPGRKSHEIGRKGRGAGKADHDVGAAQLRGADARGRPLLPRVAQGRAAAHSR